MASLEFKDAGLLLLLVVATVFYNITSIIHYVLESLYAKEASTSNS